MRGRSRVKRLLGFLLLTLLGAAAAWLAPARQAFYFFLLHDREKTSIIGTKNPGEENARVPSKPAGETPMIVNGCLLT